LSLIGFQLFYAPAEGRAFGYAKNQLIICQLRAAPATACGLCPQRFHSPYSDFMPKGTFLFGSVFILVTKEK